MDDRGLTALVTALETLPVPATYEEWQAAMDRSYATDAAAILAALHEAGWALVRRAALADQP